MQIYIRIDLMSKVRKPKKSSELDDEDCSAIESLGKTLIEEFQEENQDDLEVFELYTHALKSKIHLREKDFCNRLVRGYAILLKTLRPDGS